MERIKKYEPLWGKWIVKRKLGEGSFGAVYEAEKIDDISGNATSCAVKLISIKDEQLFRGMNPRETLSADEWEKIKKKKLKKVLKEAEVMEKLESRDHIVELKNYDHISNEKTTDILMRMELLTNLNDYLLGTAENSEIRLKEQVIKIGIDLCKGLEECEAERIVHCDIKPENIFVNKSNTFKLGDFGLSHKFAASSLLGSMGTRMYMSPEAAGYGKHIDYRSDIYSLGIVLYELLNDRKIPFSSDSFDSDKIEDAITRRMSGEKIVYPIHERGQLWTIIQKACQFESKDRYQHASEMRRDLEKLKYEERNDSIRNDLEITIESDIGSTIEEKSYRDKNTNYLEKIIDKQKGKKQGKETAGKGLTTKKKWKINSKQVTKLVTIGFIIMFFVGTQRVVSQPSGFKIVQEVQNFFGDCYYHGKYYEGAVSWYNKAASKGNVSAQINLGNCYYDGVGVKKDYKEAVEWYKKAAEQGDSSAQNGLGNCYYSGEGVEQDYKEAVKWYKKAAEQEYAEGQCSLGACYYNGEGVKKNYKEAVKWYKKAAEQGNASAQASLGNRYYYGEGVEKNYKEAVKWYKKAAEQGDSSAQNGLGNCYYSGEGVEQDYKEAVRWYKKAAEQENAWGQCNLGDCYYSGKGVKKNYKEAVKWYKKAAEQENAWGQNSLGNCYYSGEGVEQDYKEAVKWYKKAAEQEYAEGQCSLGACYYNGEGVKKNYKEAVKWYKKAAEQGNARGQCNLGDCYYYGEGVKENYKEAVKWYKKAAEQEYARGQCNLGDCYYYGEGVKENYKEAVKWYKKAAEQEYARGQYNLGYCYEEGLGIKKNLEKALYWYKKAVDNGLEYAKEAKKRIEKQLE